MLSVCLAVCPPVPTVCLYVRALTSNNGTINVCMSYRPTAVKRQRKQLQRRFGCITRSWGWIDGLLKQKN